MNHLGLQNKLVVNLAKLSFELGTTTTTLLDCSLFALAYDAQLHKSRSSRASVLTLVGLVVFRLRRV